MSTIELIFASIILFVIVFLIKYIRLLGQLMIYLDSLSDRYKKLYCRPHRIILVRHGESEANIDESVYRHTPDAHISLTERGKEQAIEVGKKLKKNIINSGPEESIYVYLSPYLRSKQTYEGISKAFFPDQIHKVREDPRLREQEWGNFLHPNIRRTEMEERAKVGDFFYRFTNGESGADVYDRCSLFLDTLFRENMNGAGYLSPKVDNILIVSHGLFMKLFLMRYNRWTVEKHHELREFENCEYCVLEHNRETGSYDIKTSLSKK